MFEGTLSVGPGESNEIAHGMKRFYIPRKGHVVLAADANKNAVSFELSNFQPNKYIMRPTCYIEVEDIAKGEILLNMCKGCQSK